MLDVHAQASIDAHPEIRDQGKGEERNEVPAPVIEEQREPDNDQDKDRYPVTKAVFAGPYVEELSDKDIGGRILAPLLRRLAPLFKYLFLRNGPRDRRDDKR